MASDEYQGTVPVSGSLLGVRAHLFLGLGHMGQSTGQLGPVLVILLVLHLTCEGESVPGRVSAGAADTKPVSFLVLICPVLHPCTTAIPFCLFLLGSLAALSQAAGSQATTLPFWLLAAPSGNQAMLSSGVTFATAAKHTTLAKRTLRIGNHIHIHVGLDQYCLY